MRGAASPRGNSRDRDKAERLAILDPRFLDDDALAIGRKLIRLAYSHREELGQFDLTDPLTKSILERHRVTTLLLPACVPPDQTDLLRSATNVIHAMQLKIEAVAREVLQLLSDAGVPVRVLKGLASGDLDYPTRSLRQTGDVDLLVAEEALDTVTELLNQAGFRTVEVSPKFRAKGAVLVSPSGVEVDIHTRLFKRDQHEPFDYFAQSSPLTALPGLALGPELRLVHAAAHFIIAPPGLRRISGFLDIAMLRNRHEIDLDHARSIATTLRVAPHVATVLELDSYFAGRVDDDELTDWPRFDWLDRSTLMTSERRLALEHISRMRDVQGLDRLRYLPAWLLPDNPQREKFKRSLSRRYAALRRR